MKDKINLFMKKLKERSDFNRVKFVILFGSFSQNKENKMSDVDLAIYYDGDKEERFNFRLKMLSELPDGFDVLIFQDLPLFVRMNVLKGKIIFAQDEAFVYDVAYETIKSFDDFKKHYYDYIERRPVVI